MMLPWLAVRPQDEWLLYAIGAGLFLLILLAALLALLGRRQRETPGDGGFGESLPPLPEPEVARTDASFPDPAPDPLGEPMRPLTAMAPATGGPATTPAIVHSCRCPGCLTQFTVNGAKPIVTHCPGCGKKGYLR